MIDFKKTNANKSTVTNDLGQIDAQTQNVYEAVVIISKRAEQINDVVRKELHEKLEDFATSTESLEEVFDNKEQIEVSRFYENLPKPGAIATEEWLEKEVYFRYPNGEAGQSNRGN
jgi:DNA-directed RNA polymerase subunit K/omega